jgi:mono/diheme cytochrome c family protein
MSPRHWALAGLLALGLAPIASRAASTADSSAALAVSPSDRVARLHYIQHCSGCHLADGSGSPSKGIPDMHGTLGRFLQVPGGRAFIVQVPGVMNAALKDSEVAQLMNWLLPAVSASTLPAQHQPYTEDEVRRLRDTRPANIPALRETLLARGHQAGLVIDPGSSPGR